MVQYTEIRIIYTKCNIKSTLEHSIIQINVRNIEKIKSTVAKLIFNRFFSFYPSFL